MPISIRVSGMWSVTDIRVNAAGKQLKSSTTTRISQTWLASQIGPMAPAMSARCRFQRGPPARRSHTPPPKSAPPSNTYALSETITAPARSAARVASGMLRRHQGGRRALRKLGALDDLAAQEPHDCHRECEIQQSEHQERDHEPGHRRDGVRRAEHPLDDPRLPPDFSDHPSCLDGDEPHRRAENQELQQPPVGDNVALPKGE